MPHAAACPCMFGCCPRNFPGNLTLVKEDKQNEQGFQAFFLEGRKNVVSVRRAWEKGARTWIGDAGRDNRDARRSAVSRLCRTPPRAGKLPVLRIVTAVHDGTMGTA